MMRLLFVDDEARVLQGLRQSLRSKRHEWEMVFAEGASPALEELERRQFDAVISDIRMPGMDGAELLKRVRVMQPEALRVVLSGQMDEATAVRVAASAHRFLAKPCDSEVLVATLSRALNLRAQLHSEQMQKCISGMAGLPSLPAACRALNRALENEDVAMSEVKDIVESDVGMSAKVLQLVNSSFFGLSRRISSVEQAVRNLGLNTLRSLVLANVLFEELAGDNLEMLHSEQSHSLLAAQYARRFCLEPRQVEIAVTAALLHNVGRLALISRLPAEHRANREYAEVHGVGTAEAERARLGVTHAEVGAYLLGLWGLPHDVTEAVGLHHLPLESRASLDPSAVVRLAELLAAEALGFVGHDDAVPEEVLRRLGVAETVAVIRAGITASGRVEEVRPS
jgi:HD-like signal output (HDOD) protein/CheY-like chemotaxis protein